MPKKRGQKPSATFGSGARGLIGGGKILIAALMAVCYTFSLTTGRVYRYTDSQGTLKITNLKPEKSDPSLAKTPGSVPISSPSPPVPSQKRKPSPLGLRSSRQPSISRAIDAQGVIHITNKATAVTASPNIPAPPGVLSGSREKVGLTKVNFIPSKRPGSVLSPSGKSILCTRGAIRCRRDNKGVLHIVNTSARLASQPTSLLPNQDQTLLPTGTELGKGAGPGQGEERREMGPTLAGNIGQLIMVSRDGRGILHIRNLDPQRPKLNPGKATNPALEPIIQEAAYRFCLPVNLIKAIIKVESNFVPQAVSPKGAMGLMQLMPGTADFLGVQNAFCPRENILAGCRYLRLLLNTFNNSLPLALAAYNSGYGRVIAAGYRVPAIEETQNFVTRILGRFFYGQKLKRSARPI
jgi:hypothetical protein